jgi:hypothetical protein
VTTASQPAPADDASEDWAAMISAAKSRAFDRPPPRLPRPRPALPAREAHPGGIQRRQ